MILEKFIFVVRDEYPPQPKQTSSSHTLRVVDALGSDTYE